MGGGAGGGGVLKGKPIIPQDQKMVLTLEGEEIIGKRGSFLSRTLFQF